MKFLTDLGEKVSRAWTSLHLFVKIGIIAVATLILFQAVTNFFA